MQSIRLTSSQVIKLQNVWFKLRNERFERNDCEELKSLLLALLVEYQTQSLSLDQFVITMQRYHAANLVGEISFVSFSQRSYYEIEITGPHGNELVTALNFYLTIIVEPPQPVGFLAQVISRLRGATAVSTMPVTSSSSPSYLTPPSSPPPTPLSPTQPQRTIPSLTNSGRCSHCGQFYQRHHDWFT